MKLFSAVGEQEIVNTRISGDVDCQLLNPILFEYKVEPVASCTPIHISDVNHSVAGIIDQALVCHTAHRWPAQKQGVVGVLSYGARVAKFNFRPFIGAVAVFVGLLIERPNDPASFLNQMRPITRASADFDNR